MANKYRIKQLQENGTYLVLHPETDSDIVSYNGTINSTSVTNVKDAIDSLNTLASQGGTASTNLATHIADTTKHITADERTAWNSKYTKSSGGIPKTDLSSSVQTSLGKADTALQSHQDISGKQDKITNTSVETNITFSDATWGDVTAETGHAYIPNKIKQTNGQISLDTTAGYVDVYTASKVNQLLTNNVQYLGVADSISDVTSTGKVGKSVKKIGDWARVGTNFSIYDVSTGASTTAHKGDILIATSTTISASTTGSSWDVIHTDIDTNTWRPVKVDGTNKITDSSTSLNIASGTNISLSYASGTVTITNSYSHPTTTAVNAGAYKIGKDSNGHTIIGDALTKSDIGLGNVENTAISTWAGSSNLTTVKKGTLGDACIKGVDTSISASSTSTNLPTSSAVESRINAHSGIDKTGTVTSVTLNAGTGISLNASGAITTSGSRTISLSTCGTAGTYSVVTTDSYGRVTQGALATYIGTSTTDTAPSSLAVGGIFYEMIG